MRLFVAIEVDQASRDAAVRLRDRLTREVPALVPALRFVDPARLHLTLRFLGEQQDVAALERLVTASWSQPAFALTWAGPDWLPSTRRPRVLYVGVASGREALHALWVELDVRLRQAGVPPEERPFQGHLTIARVRDGAPLDVFRRASDAVRQWPFGPGVELRIGEVVLVESRLSPRGPGYHVRARGRLP